MRGFSALISDFVLELFNFMFLSSSFPKAWADTFVMFIHKPAGKGFRRISLTSAMGKLFKRLVQRRL